MATYRLHCSFANPSLGGQLGSLCETVIVIVLHQVQWLSILYGVVLYGDAAQRSSISRPLARGGIGQS